MDTVLLTLLGFGLISGIKHAFDADHIAAISTLVSNHKSIKKSTLLGMFWGFGHTISLLVVGLIVLLLKIPVPRKISLSFEFIVGLMLVVLGLNVLATMNRNKMHLHKHKHAEIEHIHFHSHKSAKHHSHEHLPLNKSLFIGIMHGLTGSAALTLLVLSSINSIWLGLIYVLIFGIGSIIGMVLISSVVLLPLTLITNKLGEIQKLLRLGIGSVSTIIGLGIMYNTIFA
ncbi:MAG: urease accessory protein UreH [Nanoarchaeota archaeon]